MYLYEVQDGDGLLGTPIDDKSPFSFWEKRKEGDVYLCIEKEGFAVFTYENRTISDAYSLFKRFIHAGLTIGIFKKSHGASLSRNISLKGLELENDKILVKDTNNDKLDYITLNLAPNVIEFISKLELDPDYLNEVSQDQDIDDSQLIKAICNFVSRRILDIDNPYTANLLSAIDWSFESKVNPNKTFAFIQLCIALEAISSDNTGSESITKTLADRAAYFIGTSIERRRIIIDKFKELYSLRSRLVHKHQKYLNDEEKDLYLWGSLLLNRIIKKEFSLLEE